MKKAMSWLLAVMICAALFPGTVLAQEMVTNVSVTATSYQTDGILIPSYQFNGKDEQSTYRWLEADTADAPAQAWKKIEYDNSGLNAAGDITAAAAQDAYLMLSQKQTGKYIKFELTNNGVSYTSPATPMITFTPNLANNGDFNPIGVKDAQPGDKNGGEILGWKYINYKVYEKAFLQRPAGIGLGNVRPQAELEDDAKNNGTARIDLPQKLTMPQYRISLVLYHMANLNVYSIMSASQSTAYGNPNYAGGKYIQMDMDQIRNSTDATKKADAYLSFKVGSTRLEADFGYIHFTAVAPVARDVRVTGTPAAGQTLRAEYMYDAEFDNKETTQAAAGYRWLSAPEPYGPWNEIAGQDKETLDVASELSGQYIRCEVTPVNSAGVSGVPIQSTATVQVQAPKEVMVSAVDGRYDTDGILLPFYRYEGEGTEGNSRYRWLFADSPAAADGEWKPVTYFNTNVKTAGTFTSADAKEGYLMLAPSLAGKYIKLEVTPVNADGTEYPPVYSDPSPQIQKSENLIHNGTFSVSGTREDNTFYGWGNDLIFKALNAGDADGSGYETATENATWYARHELPDRLEEGAYLLTASVAKQNGGGLNWRANLNGADSGNNDPAGNMDGFSSVPSEWKTVSRLIIINDAASQLPPSVAFRVCTGSASGAQNYFMDDVCLTRIAPKAQNVRIAGDIRVGSVINGGYQYTPTQGMENAQEGESTFRWLVSDTPDGTGNLRPIEGKTGKSLLLPAETQGKYVAFEVTPKDAGARTGTAVCSAFAGPVAEGVDLGPSFDENDPFRPYIAQDAPAPDICDTYAEEVIDGVTLQGIRFVSRTYEDGGIQKQAKIYALTAQVKDDTVKKPGIVFLHGGGGSADASKSDIVKLAKEGYVVIAPDCPGIYNKGEAVEDLSEGPWRNYGYAENRFTNEVTESTIFDGVLAGIQSYHLLTSIEQVDTQKIGVTGTSWGGYHTTMLAGLLGNRITAAYSRYNGGFYDLGGAFSAAKNYPNWIKYLDAGRRAENLTANYFLMAAAKDTFVYPPAINAAIEAVAGSEKNMVYSPNASHSTDGITGGENMDLLWLNYYLKGEGNPFPRIMETAITDATDAAAGNYSRTVTVKIDSALPVTEVKLYYSLADTAWTERTWNVMPVSKAEDGVYTVILPSNLVEQSVDYYLTATDGTATGGTKIFSSRAGLKLIKAEDVAITASSNQTDAIVVPSYQITGAQEGKSLYAWQMADTPDAPDSAWETIEKQSASSMVLPADITSAEAAKAYLPLSPEQRGKYIRFAVTPIDNAGNVGDTVYSAPTDLIEFTPNIANNGTLRPLPGGITYGGLDLTEEGMHTSYKSGTSPSKLYPNMKLKANTAYRVSASMKTDMLNGENFVTKGQVFIIPSGGAKHDWKETEINSQSWTVIDKIMALNQAGASEAQMGNFEFRLPVQSDGEAKTFWVKDFSVQEVAPYAADVTISGMSGRTGAKIGDTLQGEYTYRSDTDINDLGETAAPGEGSSELKWYVSDQPYGPWQEYAQGRELVAGNGLAGKYVRFEVTPVNNLSSPRIGLAQRSRPVQVTSGMTIDSAEIVGELTANGTLTAKVQLTNTSERDLYPAVILAVYRGNTLEQAAVINNKKLQVETNNLFEISLTLPSDAEGLRAVLMIWEGTDTMRPAGPVIAKP